MWGVYYPCLSIFRAVCFFCLHFLYVSEFVNCPYDCVEQFKFVKATVSSLSLCTILHSVHFNRAYWALVVSFHDNITCINILPTTPFLSNTNMCVHKFTCINIFGQNINHTQCTNTKHTHTLQISLHISLHICLQEPKRHLHSEKTSFETQSQIFLNLMQSYPLAFSFTHTNVHKLLQMLINSYILYCAAQCNMLLCCKASSPQVRTYFLISMFVCFFFIIFQNIQLGECLRLEKVNCIFPSLGYQRCMKRCDFL